MQDHVPRQLAVGFTPMEHRREVVVRLAMRVEELGYSTVYVAEGWGYDASVLLAEVALRTSRIRLGTGVLNVWGRSAASIAMLASSLADLSDGRFELGLGAGSPPLAEGLHDVRSAPRWPGWVRSPGRYGACSTGSASCRQSSAGAALCVWRSRRRRSSRSRWRRCGRALSGSAAN